MSVFVDASALIALLDEADNHHAQAMTIWASLTEREERLTTTNYVVLETIALIQRRFGIRMVREFQQLFAPLLEVEWVEEADHSAGFDAVIAAGRRDLSLVDCTSFAAMRRLAIRRCFTFDAHFKEIGFESLP